jgi:hypothetical protein
MSTAPTATDRNLRLAAVGAIGVAALWPVLPAHPPLACPLRSLTGIPCPLCGMTRGVVAAIHGDFVAALRYNPGAFVVLLAVAVVLVKPALLTRVRISPWVTGVALGTLWIWNVGFNPTFHQWFLP